MKKKNALVLTAVLASFVALFAGVCPAEERPAESRLRAVFGAVSSGRKPAGGKVFIAVAEAGSGRPVYASDDGFLKKGRISPGSIAKVICAALLLDTPGFDPDRKFYCSDSVFLDGYRFTCSYKGGHGTTNLADALARSCNLYFKDAMRRVDRRRFARAAELCGMLSPGEANALVSEPDHLYYQAVIGDHSLKATPESLLKLFRYLACGVVNEPGYEGFSKVFGREAARVINSALRDVVERGTASGALRGSGCAGKTGSPVRSVSIEKGRRVVRTDAVFLGYYPYIEPEYVFIVFMENGTGGADAAEAAKKLLEAVSGRRKAAPPSGKIDNMTF